MGVFKENLTIALSSMMQSLGRDNHGERQKDLQQPRTADQIE